MVSWSIKLDCERALEYFYDFHVGRGKEENRREKGPPALSQDPEHIYVLYPRLP